MDKYQEVCYESMENKAIKKSTRYAAMMFALLFLVYGVLNHILYACVAGVLFGIAMLFEKKLYVTELGLEMDYKLVVKLYHDVWSFDEIEAIYREPMKETGVIALNVMKGLSGKRLVFSADVAKEVIKMALEKNSKIDYNVKV